MDSNTLQNPNVDWQGIWDELDWNDQQRQQKTLNGLLNHRARQYAAPNQKIQQEDEYHKYEVLIFDLGSERYAIDVSAVRGVLPLGRVTRVPGAPYFYHGVVNVRGQILAVLDLRRFFNIGPDDDHDTDELVLISANGLELALLADHVQDVMSIPHVAIEPVEMRYARGITLGRLLVLDIEQLCADERLIVGRTEDA